MQVKLEVVAVGWNQFQGPEPHQGAFCVTRMLLALDNVPEDPVTAAEVANRSRSWPSVADFKGVYELKEFEKQSDGTV